MSRLSDAAEGIGGTFIGFLYLAMALVILVAFMEGLEVWFGFGTILSIVTFVIVALLGPLGGIFLTVVAFYGAWQGWGWEWWQAALLCFPFVAVAIIMALGFGVTRLFQGRRSL